MALNVFVVTPIGNALPLGSPAIWVIDAIPQASVAVGAPHETAAVQFPGSVVTLKLEGALVKTGLVKSCAVVILTE